METGLSREKRSAMHARIDKEPQQTRDYRIEINSQLQILQGNVAFEVHEPCPEGVTLEELEQIAADYRAVGLDATVSPIDPETEGSPIGLRIEYKA